MDIKRQLKAVPGTCRICGASAIYSYFGAIACAPCKIFFKRNARNGLKKLKCDLNNHCEINITTRHLCSYCRLRKCFTSGMQTELIRSSVSKNYSNNKKLKSIHQKKQFSIINLLQTNLLSLTTDQLNIISNLFHSYENDSGLLLGKHYMYEQKLLPYKLRFKYSSIIEIIEMIFNKSLTLYKTNDDFLSLSLNDRSILLHHTIEHISNISLNFILYKIDLMSQPRYYEAISMIFDPDIIPIVQCFEHRLNIDMITMKLYFAVLLFSFGCYSTIDYSYSTVYFTNYRQILKIQDKYIELTWQYFLSKYHFDRAVMIFSDFIRLIFNIYDFIIRINDIQWYRNIIDKLIQQIEQNILL